MSINKIIVLACLFLATPLLASRIQTFDYSQVDQLASHIVIGKVISTTEDKPAGACNARNYEATMEIVSSIKGSITGKVFTLPVCIGSKGFNSELREGSTYIFFLKESNGKYQRVHPRSVTLLKY